MKKQLGFTLAEVLITLGIIGVVAAMTIPTLMSNTNSSEMRTAFKKILSTMNQAVTMSVALNYVDFADITDSETGDGSLYQILNDKMHIIKTVLAEENDDVKAMFGDSGSSNYTLFFADGMALSYNPENMVKCTKKRVTEEDGVCKAIVDVNGKRKPNRISNCKYNLESGDGKGETIENDQDPEGGACTKDNADIADQFSVKFQGQQVLPNGYAARYTLYDN